MATLVAEECPVVCDELLAPARSQLTGLRLSMSPVFLVCMWDIHLYLGQISDRIILWKAMAIR